MEYGLMLCLFLFTANLDTFLLAAIWRASGRQVTVGEGIILTLATSAMTGLSLLLGLGGGTLWNIAVTKRLSTLILVAMGIWMLLDWLRQLDREETAALAPKDRRGFSACLLMGVALGANNSGLGLAAGLAGIAPLDAVVGNGLVTVAALALGQLLGGRWLGRALKACNMPVSAALLILLGALAGI